jgi:hypothetical protein
MRQLFRQLWTVFVLLLGFTAQAQLKTPAKFIPNGSFFIADGTFIANAVQTVPRLTARDSIATAVRYNGMYVTVTANKKIYRLDSVAGTPNNWIEYSGGGVSADSVNKFYYFIEPLNDTAFLIASKDGTRKDTISFTGTIANGSGSGENNIYNSNGALTSDRDFGFNNKSLTYKNAGQYRWYQNYNGQWIVYSTSSSGGTIPRINLSADIDTATLQLNTTKLAFNSASMIASTGDYKLVSKNNTTGILETIPKTYYKPFNSSLVEVLDADYTITSTDEAVWLQDPTALRTLTLPDPATCVGRRLSIFHTSKSETIWKWTFAVTGASNVLNVGETEIVHINTKESMELIATSDNWRIIQFKTF